MFTGIVTDLGEIRSIRREGDMRLVIGTHYPTAELELGASIAHNGVCLTVIAKGADWYEVQASDETLSKTTMGSWRVGQRINLERALRLGDELGGHLVSGHVDGVARLADKRPEKDSLRLGFTAPAELARFVAPKGSVALDGVSLTVNEVEGARFGVNIIPHTQQATTLGGLAVGDPVNMEIDMLARYVARLIAKE
jgi:riboflavin synthase